MEDNSFVEDYDIAVGSNPKALVDQVRKLLAKEYEPDGDVFKDNDGNLCQKMILVGVEK